jgi:uncharacterized repeat protein (TIGR02543 family)
MSLTIVVSSAPPTQNTFKIAYNLNGGSGSVPMSTFTDSSSTYYGAVTGTVPSREGYVFLGWWTSPGGNSFGSYSHAGDSVYFSAPGTITLYAIWQVPKWDFVIHYDANGGSGAPPDSVFADRTDPRYVAALSASVPSWAGRNFAGWALTASGEDGSGASTIIAGNCYEFDAPAVTEVTVFAQWLSAVEGGAALWFIGDSFEFEARPGQAFEKTFITNVPAEITMESPHAWLQLSGGRLFGTAPADGAETAYELILHATAGPNHCERVVKVIVKPDGEGAAAGNAALILILIGAMFCAVVFWPKKRGRR